MAFATEAVGHRADWPTFQHGLFGWRSEPLMTGPTVFMRRLANRPPPLNMKRRQPVTGNSAQKQKIIIHVDTHQLCFCRFTQSPTRVYAQTLSILHPTFHAIVVVLTINCKSVRFTPKF